MKRSAEQLRSDAVQIWQAGLEAVRSDRLVRETVQVDGHVLTIGEESFDLERIGRIVVVGAGKAGAGMAAGLEEALGPEVLDAKEVRGWVNVPANCVRPLHSIHLHPARPAGVNEPTEAGVAGAEEILRLVESLGADDLCLALISGGGSALLPAPAAGIGLEDKLAVTRFLSGAGANIEELNTVRKQLSRIKGGGLARACKAGRLITLIISDVLGDPLDVIASGPTIENRSTAADALAVLERFGARQGGIAPAVFEHIERAVGRPQPPITCRVENLIIGNNALAVDAAGLEAERLGYSHAMMSANRPEGTAEQVGHWLAEMALSMRDTRGPDCLISGGEPVVKLIDQQQRGLGGRNQQLVLAAAKRLRDDGAGGIVLLSAGTDGEDGPTDAAGALLDSSILEAASERGLDLDEYLRRNDAYHFFEPLGGLIKTGATDTNVCDVRVVVVERVALEDRSSIGEAADQSHHH